MNILDLVGKALGGMAGGGLLGLAGQALVGWLENKRLDAESRRRIAEAQAFAEIKAEEAAWGAFTASQKSAELPANVPGWCAAIITLFRPILTLLFFGLAAYAFAGLSAEQQAGVIGEIFACAFGLAYWWFGSRHQSRLRSK